VTLSLFKSYLTDRTQCVSLGNYCSEFNKITCGVPQGSILGPLLFIIYINDINRCSSILNFILFADDTTIFISGKDWPSTCAVLENELAKLSDWFKANKLSLNVDKTNLITFRRPREPLVNIKITLDNSQIKQVRSTKFLGVEIDEFLSWRDHIKKIESKVSAITGILGRIRYKLSEDTACLLYNTLILPHLNYCNIVWGNNYKCALNKILVLQKRAMRICTLSDIRLHVSSAILFARCSSLNIFDLNKVHVLKFMNLLDSGLLPKTVCNMFRRINIVHQHFTRGCDRYFHIRSACAARKFSVLVNGPNIWDSLSCDIKNGSLQSFNKRVKQSLLELYI
jgi:hypothetical protein